MFPPPKAVAGLRFPDSGFRPEFWILEIPGIPLCSNSGLTKNLDGAQIGTLVDARGGCPRKVWEPQIPEFWIPGFRLEFWIPGFRLEFWKSRILSAVLVSRNSGVPQFRTHQKSGAI